jgi:tetratricopeptide (TPR) repeat protein
MMIANELPQSSLALARQAVRIHETVRANLAKEIGQGRTERIPSLATAYNKLASSLSAVGKREEALAPAREAADLYRELAAKAPDAYRPDLAMALNTLANRLSEVGQREAALAPAKEAADLYRELAAKAPDAYRPDLAVSLMAYANCLDAAGADDTAIEQNREAIEVYTPCFMALPAAFADRAQAMCAEYLTRCEKLGREPDMDLLGPIAAVLVRMQDGSVGDEKGGGQ